MDNGRIFLVLALVLIGGASSTVAQDGCEEQPDGSVICDWGDGERDAGSGGQDDGGGSFWTSGTAQAIYAVLGLTVAVAGTIYAQQRLKTGRRHMYRYLRTVDQLMRRAKEDPVGTIPEMQRVRTEIQTHHEQARLEDAQFLELDKRLSRGLLRSRVQLLQRHFPRLPEPLLQEIREVMSDEVLSKSDLESLDRKARDLDLPSATRHDLIEYISGWISTDPDVPEKGAQNREIPA